MQSLGQFGINLQLIAAGLFSQLPAGAFDMGAGRHTREKPMIKRLISAMVRHVVVALAFHPIAF